MQAGDLLIEVALLQEVTAWRSIVHHGPDGSSITGPDGSSITAR